MLSSAVGQLSRIHGGAGSDQRTSACVSQNCTHVCVRRTPALRQQSCTALSSPQCPSWVMHTRQQVPYLNAANFVKLALHTRHGAGQSRWCSFAVLFFVLKGADPNRLAHRRLGVSTVPST